MTHPHLVRTGPCGCCCFSGHLPSADCQPACCNGLFILISLLVAIPLVCCSQGRTAARCTWGSLHLGSSRCLRRGRAPPHHRRLSCTASVRHRTLPLREAQQARVHCGALGGKCLCRGLSSICGWQCLVHTRAGPFGWLACPIRPARHGNNGEQAVQHEPKMWMAATPLSGAPGCRPGGAAWHAQQGCQVQQWSPRCPAAYKYGS